ncbi:MAG TPA: hypothetical protein VIH61_08620, partial [Waddliaceae bacterium]
MKLRFFLLAVLLSTSCFGQTRLNLSLEESAILRKFFQVLVEESEAGYVFFNKKPVCIHGYFYKDVFVVNSPVHRQAVALREGARLWRQLSDKNSDIIIHIAEKEDPNIPGYIHVLVINQPLFHHIVQSNLPLFQYILGPSVTSDNLLSALISENRPFHSLLKDDKVLIGEIL